MDSRQEAKLKIVFFGTSEFGAVILEKLISQGMKPVLVVATPDKPAGRKQLLTYSPVKLAAEKYDIPVSQPANLTDNAYVQTLRQQRGNIYVVAAYGKILPKEILDIPTYGALNVHPSLLPQYRGPSPVQTAILNGDEETGVTIMRMDEKIDHGPILAQQELQISNDQFLISKATYTKLHNTLAEIGANLLIKTIPQFVEGKIKLASQNDSKATYTKQFTKEDGKINWVKSADEIERQVRALTPWPGTYTTWNGKILKILSANVLKQTKPLGKPGLAFLTQDKKLAIQTGANALIVEKLQLEGKKAMSAKDFLLGYKDFIGTMLC